MTISLFGKPKQASMHHLCVPSHSSSQHRVPQLSISRHKPSFIGIPFAMRLISFRLRSGDSRGIDGVNGGGGDMGSDGGLPGGRENVVQHGHELAGS